MADIKYHNDSGHSPYRTLFPLEFWQLSVTASSPALRGPAVPCVEPVQQYGSLHGLSLIHILSYRSIIADNLNEKVDRLISDLAETTFEESGPLISRLRRRTTRRFGLRPGTDVYKRQAFSPWMELSAT